MIERRIHEEAPMTFERIVEIDKARGAEDLDEYTSRLVATAAGRYAIFQGNFGGRYVHFQVPQGASEEWIRQICALYQKFPRSKPLGARTGG